MLLQELVVLPLLIQSAKGWGERPRSNHKKPVIPELPDVCTANYTVTDTTTVQVTRYVDYTINLTTTQIITECTTTTLHYTTAITETDTDSVTITNTDTALVTITNTGTDSVTITNTDTDLTTITNTGTDSVTITTTDTDSVTITNTETDLTTITNTGTDSVTVTTTETDSTTVTNTETDSVTITNTETDSVTITNTDTTTTTTTIFSTTYDPCPKSCTISAETVNLYFWPTNRPYTYPTTYYHSSLDYTFTSPSVYMLIPTAVGINTANQTAGPQTTSWIIPLNIWEVSTIDGLPQQPQTPGAGYGGGVPSGGVTRQITLADLGTDCPQTADPTAIATMLPESRCNPILAAPSQVRSWAYPCNACGKFGLFDPPYAVPTVTGGLFPEPETSTTVVTIPPPVIVTATHVPVETSPPPAPVASGTVVVEYYNTDGGFLSSSVLPTTGVTGTVTRSVTVFGPSTTAEAPGVSSTAEGGITTGPIETTSEPGSVPTGGVTTSSVATASARRWVGEIVEGRNKWFAWVAGVAFVMFWL